MTVTAFRDHLRVSGWIGGKPLPPAAMDRHMTLRWALREVPARSRHMDHVTLALNDERRDLSNWRAENVGWGVVLPPIKGRLSAKDARAGKDMPEPIQRLIKERLRTTEVKGKAFDRPAPVFRYVPSDVVTYLNSADESRPYDLSGSALGMGDDSIPFYLLICGSPETIPWRLQYVLGRRRCVGRLDLRGAGLKNYVDALLSDWKGAKADPMKGVIWSVVHNDEDITRTMRDAIAESVVESAVAGKQVAITYIDGNKTEATHSSLKTALQEDRPAIIVTTSHGRTDPLEDPKQLASQLGTLVDQHGGFCTPAELLDGWNPDGAIWYAHACCSAGCDSQSIYTGLFSADADIGRMLLGVSKCGALTAPLPQALLGAERPLRAFVGHVEPTFDYTLVNPESGQPTTPELTEALYPNLFRPEPVGYAFLDWQHRSSTLSSQYMAARQGFDRGRPTEGDLFYYALAGADVQATVILGDPAAMLPK